MSWSAPCEAIDRNAPPMKPGEQRVRLVESDVEIDDACSLPGATRRCSRIAPQPPVTPCRSDTRAEIPPRR